MKARQIENLGIPHDLAKPAKWAAAAAREAGRDRLHVAACFEKLLSTPAELAEDPHFGDIAREMALREKLGAAARIEAAPILAPVPFRHWGDDIEAEAKAQMERACRLPVAFAGALMPDAHVGYGLPIGGVLATRNAVIPYAVGVDIACRMKLSILDLPAHWLDDRGGRRDLLRRALEAETRFGMGASFRAKGGGKNAGAHLRSHEVLDEDWSVSPITRKNREKAADQLGTSGSGNHFVEFGLLTAPAEHAAALGLAEGGEYIALLSHSGSRGPGAAVCDHYARLASALHPQLPPELRHLAWLDLASDDGREYWAAMELMGRFAAANHACIHRAIAKNLKAQVLSSIENHHNFAWKETHPDPVTGTPTEVVVHRKGATPAGEGALGIIPGSMATPGFVVRGKNGAQSLASASHGAGRRMSRTKARETYRWGHIKPELEKRGVEVLSAGVDENPFVYKDIEEVMAAQADLVETLARFDPKLVKMAEEGEKAED